MDKNIKVGDVFVIPAENNDCGTFRGARSRGATKIRIREVDNKGYPFFDILDANGNNVDSCSGCFDFSILKREMIKVSEASKAKFLLRYLNSSLGVEEFATLAELRARVKSVIADRNIRRDSLCVYEIKSVLKVKVDERISIGSK